MCLPDADETVSECRSEIGPVGILAEIDTEALGLLDGVLELEGL